MVLSDTEWWSLSKISICGQIQTIIAALRYRVVELIQERACGFFGGKEMPFAASGAPYFFPGTCDSHVMFKPPKSAGSTNGEVVLAAHILAWVLRMATEIPTTVVSLELPIR
jgi:hypothetical protein